MAKPSPELRRQRQQLRAARLALTAAQRREAERAITRLVLRRRLIRPGTNVALYVATRGEVDVGALVRHAWRIGARVYLPRVTSVRRKRMAFVPWAPGTRLARSRRYGLLEPEGPAGDRGFALLRLDLAIVPMLGFDARGHRLGMGAGFYDRALAARRGDERRAWRRPKLVGVAFACQQLAALDASPWDVAVDRVATEREWIVPTVPARPDPPS